MGQSAEPLVLRLQVKRSVGLVDRPGVDAVNPLGPWVRDGPGVSARRELRLLLVLAAGVGSRGSWVFWHYDRSTRPVISTAAPVVLMRKARMRSPGPAAPFEMTLSGMIGFVPATGTARRFPSSRI